MTKASNKNILITLGIIAIVVAVGIAAYVLQQGASDNQTQTTKEKNCTTYNGTIEEQCAEDYIGLSADEARDKAEKNNMQSRSYVVDGEPISYNDIPLPAPIYFKIEKDVVIDAFFEHDR